MQGMLGSLPHVLADAAPVRLQQQRLQYMGAQAPSSCGTSAALCSAQAAGTGCSQGSLWGGDVVLAMQQSNSGSSSICLGNRLSTLHTRGPVSASPVAASCGASSGSSSRSAANQAHPAVPAGVGLQFLPGQGPSAAFVHEQS